MAFTPEQAKWLKKQSKKYPANLVSIPLTEWPDYNEGESGPKLINVLRNRSFLVQVFLEKNGTIRLSINRTKLNGDGEWSDQISWDELQRLKRQAGYTGCLAVEVYPRDSDLVNISNMRHLWIMPDDFELGWQRTP